MSEIAPETEGSGETPFTQEHADQLAALQAAVDEANARADAAQASASEATGKPVKYAVYDLTYLRFVGDAQDTKAKASKLAKDRKVDKHEIREV